MNDFYAIIVSFVFIFSVLGIAETLRKQLHYTPDFTRKVVHVSVGMWSLGTVLLFQNRWMAIVPPLVFVVLNYISYRQDMFKAMENDDKSNMGTVYFPLAFAIIILIFWDTPDKVVAALMPMTWGDAMAAVLGKRFGRISYTVLGHTRTVEGSLSMFFFSGAATFLALWFLLPATGLWLALGVSLGIAIAATLAEAVSPWGIDNLSVPAVASLILYFT